MVARSATDELAEMAPPALTRSLKKLNLMDSWPSPNTWPSRPRKLCKGYTFRR